jgi:uncharacterized protein with NRDE domain
MCLILLAVGAHPDCPLVIAANRDEYHGRPTAPAAFWPDAPVLLAGRDLEGGGSWFGVTRAGRFAAVTNYRDLAAHRPGRSSRGELVRSFLTGDITPADYLALVGSDRHRYNDFNLLCGLLPGPLFWYSNRAAASQDLPAGVHGLANHLLDTPWPKVAGGKAELAQLLVAPPADLAEALFALLADRGLPPDRHLPRTGVGLARERLLAPRFIVSPTYGTRSSTTLIVRQDGTVQFRERSFDPAGEPTGTVLYEFQLPVNG